MIDCLKCKNKTCLKDGKPCKRVELYLQSQGIKSQEWIRPKMPHARRNGSPYREIPFSSLGRTIDGEMPTRREK